MKSRLSWTMLALVSVAIITFAAWYLAARPFLAEAVAIHLVGIPSEASAGVRVMLMGPEKTYQAFRGRTLWGLHGSWVRGIYLYVPADELPRLTEVKVILGEKTFVFDSEAILHMRRTMRDDELPEQPSPGDVVLSVPNEFGRVTQLPWLTEVSWNWPGDDVYLAAVGKYTLVPLAFVWLLGFQSRLVSQPWYRQLLGFIATEGQPQPSSAQSVLPPRAWNIIGWVFLAGAFACLEWQSPYYFTQDDCFLDALPMMLVGCRQVWNGYVPDYNPYQFAGSPLASVGIYGLTYPPLYLAYGLARHVLADEYATLEVLAALHLAAGFWLTRTLARKLGLGPLAANLVSLSFVLSGSIVIIGRCWYFFLAVATWLPILCLGLVRLQHGPVTWKWLLGMGTAAGMPFHVGFPQLAVYVNAAVALVAICQAVLGFLSWKRVMLLVPVFLIGAGLALPLVYQQWLLGRNLQRFSPSGEGIGIGVPALFLPYPLVEAQAPTHWCNINRQHMGHLYFCGGLLAWLAFAQAAALLYFRPGKTFGPEQVWTLAALLAFWLSLGDAGGLWWLMSRVPGISVIQRYPFRLLPVMIFFTCLSGGFVLERLVRLLSSRGELIVAGMALALLGLHVAHCHTGFYTFRCQPYPLLPEPVREYLWQDGQPTGRIASWGVHRSAAENFGLFLAADLPAAHHVPALDGYCPFLDGNPLVTQMLAACAHRPLETLSAYGVRWHFNHAPGQVPPVSSFANASWMAETPKDQLWRLSVSPAKFPAVHEGDGLLVTKLATADPLAFARTDPTRSLPMRLHGHGLDVDVSSLPRDKPTVVVVNFFRFPDTNALVDGRPVDCREDSWNRILVIAPAGARQLSIRYSPPWSQGLYLGMVLAASGAGLFLFLRRRVERLS